mmetsp:Transcript_7092/g.15494  ORF Transcript_7092/g.15494 Transcript_7092/m.15494 type:complete len:648 (+) Transcript_7092:264-2207(+)|eukprot:CAMPEP_0178485878 /NCGR_PEP_ID=MMETSP0696-20121128/8507_1 /TAXON_ID=265572 /ORGANISM="Extubocellulus spinifer, Strain CCMP396" /LENGTH=647 /DNA_ID=CAMNT_0020113501 /DNA_START=170 /DNA_END=2113 /DNA_ORIENTATION=-
MICLENNSKMRRGHGRQSRGGGGGGRQRPRVALLDLPPPSASGGAVGAESSTSESTVISGRTANSIGIESTASASVASLASVDSQMTARISNTATTGSSSTAHPRAQGETMTARSRGRVGGASSSRRQRGGTLPLLSEQSPERRRSSTLSEAVVVAEVMAELEAELDAEENASRQKEMQAGKKPLETHTAADSSDEEFDVHEGPASNNTSSALPRAHLSQSKESKLPAAGDRLQEGGMNEISLTRSTKDRTYQPSDNADGDHIVSSPSSPLTLDREQHDENSHDGYDTASQGSHLSLEPPFELTGNETGSVTSATRSDSLTEGKHSKSSKMPNQTDVVNKDVEAAEALFRMGLMEMESGNLGAARHCLEQSLLINQATFGLDHPTVGDIQHTLGLVQLKYGQYETACITLWEAQRIRKLNLDLVGAADSMQEIGNVHCAGGRMELALDCYGECLRVRRTELGDHHLKVAFAYVDIGNVEGDLGRKEDACDHFKNALTILKLNSMNDPEKNDGKIHDKICLLLENMSKLELEIGAIDHALEHLQEFVETRRSRNQTGDSNYVEALLNVAKMSMEHGDDATAYDSSVEAMEVYEANRLDDSGHAELGRRVKETFQEVVGESGSNSTSLFQRFGVGLGSLADEQLNGAGK